MDGTSISVRSIINSPIEKVWKTWVTPEDIVQWYTATPEWHTPKATNDLKAGGKFVFRMEAKDGSMGFDYGGTYTEVNEHTSISFQLDDGRKVEVLFSWIDDNTTEVKEVFEPETTNPIEMQQQGWQAILDNFKNYVES